MWWLPSSKHWPRSTQSHLHIFKFFLEKYLTKLNLKTLIKQTLMILYLSPCSLVILYGKEFSKGGGVLIFHSCLDKATTYSMLYRKLLCYHCYVYVTLTKLLWKLLVELIINHTGVEKVWAYFPTNALSSIWVFESVVEIQNILFLFSSLKPKWHLNLFYLLILLFKGRDNSTEKL